MKRTSSSLLASAVAVASLLALPAGLWAQSSGGNIEGTVVDAQGAPLPGVRVTATNSATGFSRAETTGVDGSFRMPSLPIGEYDVVAELDGYGTLTQERVVVNVASTRSLEVTLQQSTVQESITVVDEAPLIANAPSIGTVVSQEELESLPLNGRQFANLAVLAPGTQLTYNSDPTKPGQLQVALNGGIGRNVNYVIDGGDNTDDTIGGALQNFNLEAVQEFKIQTMQYKAEYGRSSGGVLSVVTKTGTNEFAGSVYEYYRDDSLATQTETEKLAGIGKQPYSRDQYGVSLGGPIVRDRAHFFGTYEKTERETSYTIDTGGILPALDGRATVLPFEDKLATVKASVDLTASQLLSVRYGYQENADKYGASPGAAPSSLGTVSNEYSSVLANHTALLSGTMLNEFVFQYTKFANAITADSDDPTVYFPSGVHFGQNINTPQTTNQKKYQYKDDFSLSTTLGGDRHDFKFGANYIHEPELGGDFSTGLSGQFTLLQDRLGSPVTDITFFGGFFGFGTPVDQYGAYFQDDWAVTDRLTLNLGLRYDYWEGFDLDQRSNPIWRTLSTQTRFNEAHFRDFQGGRGGVLENDDNNWAPRLGFTFDLKGDSSQLLRGGYGRFYDFPYTNATILFPTAAVQSNYGVVYNHNNSAGIRNPDGSFYQPGQPLPPNQLPGADVFPPNEVASPTLATPYSDQISIGYSWQVNNWLGINVDAITIDYEDIPFRFRANPRNDANGNGVVDAGETRLFPAFGNFRMWHGGGKASYDGFNIGARARLENFELQGFYTYSEADGNVLAGADEFRITNAGHQADIGGGRRDVSRNPRNPFCGACFGPLNTDARHKLTLGGTYNAPLGINVSGFLRYRSALPYTNFIAADQNGDGFAYDFAPGQAVNEKRGEAFTQIDLRLSKTFTFGDFGLEVLGEVFNVLNDDNPALFDRFGNPNAYSGDPLQGEQRLAQLGLRLKWR